MVGEDSSWYDLWLIIPAPADTTPPAVPPRGPLSQVRRQVGFQPPGQVGYHQLPIPVGEEPVVPAGIFPELAVGLAQLREELPATVRRDHAVVRAVEDEHRHGQLGGSI